MRGKVCVVTGANSGIGHVTALELCRRGAHTVLVCRDRTKGEQALQSIQHETGSDAVELALADLSDLQQVRRLASDLLKRHDRIDVLVNNAGLTLSSRQLTAAGLDQVWCVNHLAPFLLTNLLLERLKQSAPARVVNVSSSIHRLGRIDLDDLQGERRPYIGLKHYADTKLANLLFTRELARRLDGTKVTTNALHPGVVATGFARDTHVLFRNAIKVAHLFMVSPEKGAQTSIHLASDPGVASTSGDYFINKRRRRPSSAARDDALARKLWQLSSELVRSS